MEHSSSQAQEEGSSEVADSMLIQMAFYAIPAELYENNEGEVLDSSELILYEGLIMRRVGGAGRLPSSSLR